MASSDENHGRGRMQMKRFMKILALFIVAADLEDAGAAFLSAPVRVKNVSPSFTRRILIFADRQKPQSFSGKSVSNHKDTTDRRSKPVGRKVSKKKKPRKNRSLSPETWRVFGVSVHPDLLPEAIDKTRPFDKLYLSPPVLDALVSRLKIKDYDAKDASLPKQLLDVRVVRRSLDARKKRRPGEEQGPRFTYVVDVDVPSHVAQQLRFRHQAGRMERLKQKKSGSTDGGNKDLPSKTRVVIVGAGPAGLFCALTLARSGLCTPFLLERGQPVESRGRDIGALMHRRSLNEESNFCYGEGGAGTWSDGKLTTRIGRNSDAVRHVLETLVKYGAPETILVDGSPHLGTDNLVKLLRNMRRDLRRLGGEIRFGARVTDLQYQNRTATGVCVEYQTVVERDTSVTVTQNEGTETILGDAVVLATGHSARDMYENLHKAGVRLEAKGFATGFRVEHPQSLINEIQYGREWGPSVVTGKGVTDAANREYFDSFDSGDHHQGRLPVPSYRLATDKAYDGNSNRGAYSFCMCPGGQIVPASTDPEEVCVNGMSFSRRDSAWANSALVVTIAPDDDILEPYRAEHGVLAGVAFQRDMERRASAMGGGNLTVPVQRLTDFVLGKQSESIPSSSYRLGVKSAPCHQLYPAPITEALRDAVANYFEKQMPGFLSEEALLHGVETRTSSPVRVSRDPKSMQATGVERLFPTGEGAGFAGGIVSAAVDGMVVAQAVLHELHGDEKAGGQWKGGSKSIGFTY